MMPGREISVVATVRNERAGIREFIDSLRAQSRQPDEVIIVDGESTDGTLEILREYERAGQIRLISQPCNIAEGRNLGIAAAQSELIAVTDAGCRAETDWLEQIVRAFDSPEKPDVVAANYAFETRSDFELASVLATDPPDRETSENARYFPSSRSLGFKRSAWLAVKGYPEWLYAAEDTLFNIRLRQCGLKFLFCREAVVRWRPRTTWNGLFKQYFNYARGNGRIGFGLAGYRMNLQDHALTLVLLIASLVWPVALIGAAFVLGQHARRNLWQQAKRAERITGRPKLFWLTLAAMEVVRLAGLSGFIAGRMDRIRNPRFVEAQVAWMGTRSVESPPRLPAWSSGVMLLAIPLLVAAVALRWQLTALGPALLVSVLLALKSIKDFSRTGPQLKEEILRYYAWHSLFTFTRLCGWVFVLCVLMAGAGLIVLEGVAALFGLNPSEKIEWLAALGGIAVVSALQFCRHLLHIPGSIAASSNYRLSRFFPLWRMLSPGLLKLTDVLIGATLIGAAAVAASYAFLGGDARSALVLIGCACLYALLMIAAAADGEPRPQRQQAASSGAKPMNVLMIGADTLRADRLGIEGYARALTPTLDALSRRGTYLAQCYIPCGRTAPSLGSLLTGTWPHTHGIRENFALASEMSLHVRTLPDALASAGYDTIAISDWAGADLGKYPFGFGRHLLPTDQWNIRYLIRQGPKDIRLFLSLFTHNRFGRRFLPEIYYLAGVPMTDELGRATRKTISECASGGRPFLINTFFSTTHAPFGSEYPYYTLFAGKDHVGPSKFVMGLMNDPFEIIKQQRHTAMEFDLTQIHALYDGCVRRFDDEVKRTIEHLDECGLLENTLIVIYSDHGIEFFERDSWGQGNSVVVDGSSRIPLIVVDPRRPHAMRIDEITRSIDIAPTILDLVGLALPATMEGVSLKDRIDGRHDKIDLPAFEETGIWFTRIPSLPDGHLHYPDLPELLEVPDKALGTLSFKAAYRDLVIRARDRAVRLGRWKLVYMPMESGVARYALFDLQEDPACHHDVAEQYPEIVKTLRDVLSKWMRETERQPMELAPERTKSAHVDAGSVTLRPLAT